MTCLLFHVKLYAIEVKKVNTMIFEIIKNALQFLVVSFLSLFSVVQSQEKIIVDKPNTIVPIYEVNYMTEVPKQQDIKQETVLVEEQIPVIDKKEEIIKETKNEDVYVGRLTGYGPDCYGCSGTGNLACRTKNGDKHSLVTNGIYYEDDTYGKIRILAAATAFPCGTIMEVTKEGYPPYYGVVLDRGGTMNSEWSKGNMFVDLAYEKNALSGSDQLTGTNITFKIIRYGW